MRSERVGLSGTRNPLSIGSACEVSRSRATRMFALVSGLSAFCALLVDDASSVTSFISAQESLCLPKSDYLDF
jgi:hypothetical protein